MLGYSYSPLYSRYSVRKLVVTDTCFLAATQTGRKRIDCRSVVIQLRDPLKPLHTIVPWYWRDFRGKVRRALNCAFMMPKKASLSDNCTSYIVFLFQMSGSAIVSYILLFSFPQNFVLDRLRCFIFCYFFFNHRVFFFIDCVPLYSFIFFHHSVLILINCVSLTFFFYEATMYIDSFYSRYFIQGHVCYNRWFFSKCFVYTGMRLFYIDNTVI